MVRAGAVIAKLALGLCAGLLLAGTAFSQAASPQAPQPENEESRFSFFRASGGFVRLDGESGQVSLCTRHEAGWLCQAAPEERSALEAEIARLQVENATLKKEVLTHGLPLPAGVRPDSPAASGAPASDRGLAAVASAIGNAWHRFVAMVASVRRDIMS